MVHFIAESGSSDDNPFLGFLCIGGFIVAVVLAVKNTMTNQKATNSALGVTGGVVNRTAGFNYLGGHPRRVDPAPNVTLVHAPSKIGIESKETKLLFSILRTEVQGIEIATEEEMQKRITATRLLLTGIFAFAWKKRSGGSVMIAINTASGPYVFEAPKKTKAEVMSALSPELARMPRARASPEVPPSPRGHSGSADRPNERTSVRERLKELESLHAEGLITAEEYEQRRSRFLDQL